MVARTGENEQEEQVGKGSVHSLQGTRDGVAADGGKYTAASG